MRIRDYSERDLDALHVIHAAQGFDYAFPDLRNPLFVTKLILSEEDLAPGFSPASSTTTGISPTIMGAQHAAPPSQQTRPRRSVKASGEGNCRILGAAFLRLTAEAYLLLDPRAGTPRERWQWLLSLHQAASRDAWQRGLEDVHAWLPPPIAKKFGCRLARLGWRRDDSWTPYCLRLDR